MKLKKRLEQALNTRTLNKASKRSWSRRLVFDMLEERLPLAGDLQLVKDINTTSATSNPANFVAVGSTVFFTASDPINGIELWKTDSTTGGTTLVKDIASGTTSSDPRYLTNIGGLLYFSAQTSANGREVWTSDGTTAGTSMLKDIRAGGSGSAPSGFTAINSVVYFQASDGTNGAELWRTDGTSSGTAMVKDIRPTSLSSYPTQLTNVSGTLFFAANDGTNGTELWKSDGTASGTLLVQDIRTGALASYPRYLTNLGGALYFRANNGSTGYEIWKSDAPGASASLVKDIWAGSTGSGPQNFIIVNGTLFFTASDSSTGRELWKSDGTASGTILVKDILPGTSYSDPKYLTERNGEVFFSAFTTNGVELWKSNGTAAGTIQVLDINPSAASSQPGRLTNVNGTLFFSADDGTAGTELWKSDGSSSGTVRVKDIFPGSSSSVPALSARFVSTGVSLVFGADDGTNGFEPWKSDGTTTGTVILKDILPGSLPSNPRYFAEVGGTLYFTADTVTEGAELWKSDGTAAGTTLVKDIYVGSTGSNPSSLINVNGVLFFRADSLSNGAELWKSDGTALGTVLVKDIWSGSLGSSPANLTNFNGTLLFSASDGNTANGNELWKSDGTTAGTALVKDIALGSANSNPRYLTNVNGTLFFQANDSVNGSELWKSDGTATGTVLIKNIAAGNSSSTPRYHTNVNGKLFFVATDITNGYELWTSDGTSAGTVLVKDIRSGSFSSSSRDLVNVGGTLLFRATDGSTGNELWRSDGTTSGTFLVKDIASGTANSNPGQGVNINSALYFRATDGTNGYELWKSDGSLAGTVLVKNISAGGTSSNPSGFTNLNGTVYFQADDGVNGIELWKSDGTSLGTVLVNDLTGDSLSGNPTRLTAVGNRLFASASTPASAVELFMLDTTIPNNAPADLTLSATTIDENNAVNSVVGTFSTIDPDVGNSFGYTLVSGTGAADNASFTISGNQLKAALSFDFEAKSSYNIRIRTTDQGGLSFEKAFTISVTNVDEAPTDISVTPATIPENSASATTVGTLSSADPDLGETFTYSFVTGPGDTGNTSFTIDNGVLKSAASFDFENDPSYSIRVRTTDSHGLTFDKALTIGVTNVNETPTNILLSNNSVPEDATIGTTIGLLSSVDPDAGGAFTCTLVAGTGDLDNGGFSIAGNALKTGQLLNFEVKNSYSVRIRSTDQGGLTFEKPFTITVSDVFEKVSGVVWLDSDADGIRDAGEPSQAGWTVYVDSNNNSLFDSGEPSTISQVDNGTTPEDETGRYEFALANGTHAIRRVMQSGFEPSAPSLQPGSLPATLAESVHVVNLAGVSLGGRNFGNSVPVTRTVGFAAGTYSFNENAVSVGNENPFITATVDVPFTTSTSIPVTVAAGGTATQGPDYALVNGTLQFAAGSTTGTVQLLIKNDTEYEANESFTITIGSSSFANVDTAKQSKSATIVSDDLIPKVQFSAASQPAIEGSTDSTVSVGVMLSHASDSPITIQLVVSANATATLNSDYVISGGLSITIPAGFVAGSKTITIKADGADPYEGLETIAFALGTVTGATKDVKWTDGLTPAVLTHYVRIAANGLPKVAFSARSADRTEGQSATYVNVTISPAPTSDITVPLTLSGTATNSSDYSIKLGTTVISGNRDLTFTPTRTSFTFEISVINDTLVEPEPNETLILTLGTVSGAVIDKPYTLNIKDNDKPIIEFKSSNATSVFENESFVSFTVTSSAKWPTEQRVPITVGFNSTACGLPPLLVGGCTPLQSRPRVLQPRDFLQDFALTVVIPPNTTEVTSKIFLDNDTRNEGDENVVLNLGTPTGGGALGNQRVQTITINDDDPGLTISAPNKSQKETLTTLRFPVKLDDETNKEVKVQIIPGGSATLGTDYTIYTGNGSDVTKDSSNRYFITFPAGSKSKEVSVTITQDIEVEGDETITLSLKLDSGTSGGATLTTGTATLTIVDDDFTPTVSYQGWTTTKGDVIYGLSQYENYQAKIPITVQLSNASGYDLLVTPAFQEDRGAIENRDFTVTGLTDYEARIKGFVKIPAGQLSATFWVRIKDDNPAKYQGDREIHLLLNAVNHATLSSTNQSLTIKIRDNESNLAPCYDPLTKAGTNAIITEACSAGVDLKNSPAQQNPPGSGSAQFYPPFTFPIEGVSSGGFLDGSKTFFDSNFNGIVDFLDLNQDGIQQEDEPNEPVTDTKPDGSFVLAVEESFDRDASGFIEPNEGRWASVGGVDTSTGLPLTARMYSNVNEYIVTPLSSISAHLVQLHSFTVADAQLRLMASLNLPVIENFGVFDALSLLRLGDSTAAKYWVTNIEVYSTVTQIANLVAGRGDQPIAGLADTVWESLANYIAAPDSSLDLSSDAIVGSVINSVIESTGIALTASEIDGAATIIATGNARMRSLSLADYATGAAFANAIAKIKTVFQGAAADRLRDVGNGTATIATVVSEFTRTNLDSKIASTPAGTVFPSIVGVADAVVSEGDTGTKTLTFTVSRGGDASAAISVDYTTVDATALAGSDYVSKTGTLSWAAGDDSDRIVEVTINGDSNFESDEKVQLLLSTTDAHTALRRPLATGLIANDDAVTFTTLPTPDSGSNVFKIVHSNYFQTYFENDSPVKSGGFLTPFTTSVDGQDNIDDTLVVDFAATTYRNDTVSFDGKSGTGADRLEVRGGVFDSVQHTVTGPLSSQVKLVPINTLQEVTLINQSTESVSLLANVQNLTIELPGGTNWFLEDADPVRTGQMRIRETTGTYQSLLFINPSESLSILGAGASTFTVVSTDPEFKNAAGQPIMPLVVGGGQAPNGLTLSANSIAENAATASIIGSFVSTDPNAGDTFIYTLVEGTGAEHNASFTIDSNGTLKTVASLDFENQNSYGIRVRTTDQSGLYLDKVFTILVTNVNEAPSDIALDFTAFAENQPTGSLIGTLSAVDQDADNTFTYVFTTGAGSDDNALFSIVGSSLKINGSFDYESKNSYSVRVQTTDQNGLQFEKILGLTVNDVNDAPTSLVISSSSITENLPAGSQVGSFATTDADATDLSFTYSFVSGQNNNDQFSLDGNKLLANSALNFESKSSYVVRVRTTDAGGLFFEKDLTITVENVLEMPSPAQIGDGTVQRSVVNKLVVAFDQAIEFDAGAFQVYQRTKDNNNAIVLQPVTTNVALSSTATGMLATLTFSGALTRAGTGALVDGNYQLSVNGALIRILNTTKTFDADGDGNGGGLYALGTQAADNFFALLGDANGNGEVDAQDLLGAKSALRKTAGQVGYNLAYDVNLNGVVDAQDILSIQSNLRKKRLFF